MTKLLRVCRKCQLYTLSALCPKCQSVASSPHPPKYSPQDKYAKYRRSEIA